MFRILHREGVSSHSDLRGVRVAIRYWYGWGAFSFLVLWTLMNVGMVRWEWQDISVASGIVGPESWARLRLGEIFVVLGFCAMAWLAEGRQIVTLDPSWLRIRTEIFGLGWARRYSRTDVGEIQASCFPVPGAAGKCNPDYLLAALYFDYRGKVRSFGKGLAWEDALRIEKLIRTFLNRTNRNG